MNDIYYNFDFQINTDVIFKCLKDFKFAEGKFKMLYSYFPLNLENSLKELFNLPTSSYYTLHKLDPENKDPYLLTWHIDTHRHASIIIPISEDNPNHFTSIRTLNEIIRIPYKKGIPTLINVKRLHKVSNCDSQKTRFVISIGIIDIPFKKLLEMINKNQIINYDVFNGNLFQPKRISI